MGDGEGVRASRDGDRYHYYWAARRALRLLDPTGDLTVVGVEGLPAGEVVEGEEVIDVAEYYGGGDAEACIRLRYAQLKHSTLRVDEPITASELANTLKKLAVIYRESVRKGTAEKYEFLFVANRVLNEKVRVSLAELADGATDFSHSTEAGHLRRYMAFEGRLGEEADFCRRFRVEDGSPGVAEMERVLLDELRQFLPGGGTGSELAQLIERVSRCATTLVEVHTLDRGDVLLTLRTTVEQLFPAPSRFEQVADRIDTDDIDGVVEELVAGSSSKFLITAIGGIGKSVLATTLPRRMPTGSVTVVYDCFAGGDYRKASSPRHGHRIGLTQIVNELAGQGWCIPLIPTEASATLYMQVFMHRINSAAEELAAQTPGALLTIVIDAADNAVMAAQLRNDRTFVTDLFGEDWPTNARVVQLCRPERKSLLEIFSDEVRERALRGFSRSESLLHLRTVFPDATEADGAELHALSGGNPRVQAMAMQNAASIKDTLATITFGRDRAPGAILDRLLDARIRRIAEQGHMTADERSRLCAALATLPPPLPVPDLSQVSGVHSDAIRSFAADLGRGLQIAGDTLQFRDEPTETWFSQTYGFTSTEKRKFVESILPLARNSPYVARTLPQLMFEARMFDKVVDLALSNEALPGDDEDDPERQEIARSRTRFALCAMLQTDRHAHAALLAVEAGAISSGHARLITLYRTHTDLTARFLGAETIESLCASQELAAGWPGSNLHVEAVLLSHFDRLRDTARNRLRSATDNFAAILRMPKDEEPDLRRHITDNEIADLAMAAMNIDGGAGALAYLARWRPKPLVYRVATKLCRRLADAGRAEDLKHLIVSEQPHTHVMLAGANTLFEYNLTPEIDVLVSGVAILKERKKPFKALSDHWSDQSDVHGIVWLVVHGVRQGLLDNIEAVRILNVHLPQRLPSGIAYRSQGNLPTGLLLGHALRARLLGHPLEVTDIANDRLRGELQKGHAANRNGDEFRANIPPLLPWIDCWLSALLEDGPEKVLNSATGLFTSSLRAVPDYNIPYVLINSLAEIATCILALIPGSDLVERFDAWHTAGSRALGRSRVRVARIATRSPKLELFGLAVVTRGVEILQRDRTESEWRIEELIRLGRTILAINQDEGRAIYETAVAEAASVGDELYARWQSLVITAKELATGDEPVRAYRLFQIGEALDNGHLQLHRTELAERIYDMHQPTYFAATSRARDRRAFSLEQMVSPAFEDAASMRDTAGHLALYSFAPEVSWERTVRALDPPLRAIATEVFEQFTRYERPPVRELASDRSSGRSRWDDDERESADLSTLLSSCDFTAVDGWGRALAEIPWYQDRHHALVVYALDRHPTKLAGVLDALMQTPNATMDTYVEIAVEAAARIQTPALKAAIGRLCASMATRFARSICIRSYDDERIASFTRATGITDIELTRMAMREIGRDAHHLRYDEYFYLVPRPDRLRR